METRTAFPSEDKLYDFEQIHVTVDKHDSFAGNVDEAHIKKVLRAADEPALQLTKIELCHLLKDIDPILGEGSAEQSVKANFGLREVPSPHSELTHPGLSALRYLPVANAISADALKGLRIFAGWKWWVLYTDWRLFLGNRNLDEDEKRKYLSIITKRSVLDDYTHSWQHTVAGEYYFQIDFGSDHDWIDDIALVVLAQVSENIVANFRSQVERRGPENCMKIRVSDAREFLSKSEKFRPITFLDPAADFAWPHIS